MVAILNFFLNEFMTSINPYSKIVEMESDIFLSLDIPSLIFPFEDINGPQMDLR